MTHQILKDFWINKINNLLTNFSVDPNTLDAGADWAEAMNDMGKWLDIDHFGKNICQDIYVKAGKIVPESFIAGEGYGKILDDTFTDYELQFTDLVNVFKTKIGVDPTDETLATNAEGNNILVDGHAIPKWKHTINKKFPVNPAHKQFTLNDLGELDIPDLLYRNDLYKTITDKTNGLGDLIERNLTGDDRGNGYGWRWDFKLNKTVLQNYKNNQKLITKIANRLQTILGLTPTTVVPNDWHTKLVKKTDLDAYENGLKAVLNNDLTNWQNKLNQGQQKANEYQRIHTKLNGKVSDDDLTNLLNAAPSCSHSDYDDIKQALADEKEKLTKKEESWELEKQQAQAEKEKEIINKIITDLGLTTEREREREREH
jgi:hypothetical protein